MSEQVASELVVDGPIITASRGPRVLLLCETLALTGGVERFVCQLGNELAELGMQVAVGSADEGDRPAAFPLRTSRAASSRPMDASASAMPRPPAGTDAAVVGEPPPPAGFVHS